VREVPLIPPEYLNQIITGDARELAKRIPDESVDLIYCDPVYWNIEDYSWLALVAERVLKNGASVVAQVGTHFRYDAETAMRCSTLQPCPLLVETLTANGGTQQNWKHRSIIGWKPYIWMSKGARSGNWVRDCIPSGGRDKQAHIWGDSYKTFINHISRLTSVGDVIYDPFTGGGTVPAVCKMLGRNFIASEIDPDTAERARERLRMTQPPLFVAQEEQAVMEVGA
jgi:hypothetical protein